MERLCKICGGYHSPGQCTKKENSAELSPLVFAPFAEKYAGKAILECVLMAASELDEYELLVKQKRLTNHELVEYLGLIGFFETYPAILQDANQQYKKYTEQLDKELTRSYSDPAVRRRKKYDGFVSALSAPAILDRPVLKEVVDELFFIQRDEMVTAWLNQIELPKRSISKEGVIDVTQKVFRECAKWSIASQQNRDDLSAYIFLRKVAEAYAFALNLQQSGAYSGEFDTVAAEEASDLRVDVLSTRLRPGVYECQVPDGVPWITVMYLVVPEEGKEPFTWAGVEVELAGDPQDSSKLTHTSWPISELTRELGVMGSKITTLGSLFERYGLEKEYQQFQHEIFRSIASLIESYPECILDRQQETDELERALVQEPVQEEDMDALQVSLPRAQYKEDALVAERQQKKHEIFREMRNLSFERTIKAFQRLGVEVRYGGRHIKLVKMENGRERTVPFMNRHSKGIHYMARVVRQAINILGLDEQEFVSAL